MSTTAIRIREPTLTAGRRPPSMSLRIVRSPQPSRDAVCLMLRNSANWTSERHSRSGLPDCCVRCFFAAGFGVREALDP